MKKKILFLVSTLFMLLVLHSSTVFAQMGPAKITGDRDFKWPVVGYSDITSCYYNFDYKTHADQGGHYALDIWAPTGTTVVAAYSGTVIESRVSSSWGNTILIQHSGYKGSTLYTRYSHMNSRVVNVGANVTKGQKIGTVGKTGQVSGEHLDFSVMKDSYVNPWRNYAIDPFACQLLELPNGFYSAGSGCCNTYVNEVKQLYSKPIINEPLSISDVRVSDVNSNSYKVSCNIKGNVTRVLFPTWPSADDSGNPIWHEGTISGNTASCVIRRNDHGNKTGDYISHIYIYDSAGNSISAAAPLIVMGDTQAPVISDIRVSEIKMDSFTVTCKVYDNGGVTSVKFPTWPSADDSGNPIWHEGTINGDTASCVIKKSEHGNKTGLYLTHIYAYDLNGNMTAERAPGVIIGDTEPPVIDNIKIIDVTEESYTITCTVKDNNSRGTISVRFPTWPSADDSGNPIWHEGKINGDTASCVIKKSEHGNKTGTYISHIYAYDVVGNSSSAAAPAVELGKKHQYVYTSSIKKPATCTEPGIRLYTCKDNGDSYEEEIPATGHQHTELRNVKAATCGQEGYTGDTYCKDCNIKLSPGKSIARKEHTWDSGKITTVATCTTGGIKTYTCTLCGTTKTEAIAATGHGATEIRNKKDASATSEGYTGDTYCTICNQKISSGNTIAKLTPHTATSGKTIKDKSTNGVYKVLKDGMSVEFTKPVYRNASVRIPDTIKVNGITCKVTGISANAFKNNKSLKSISIGRNVTVIGTNAFYGCKKLSKVSGGNGIVKIGHRAFANCGSLSKITIPGSVRSIGKQAFCNCKKLRSITIKTSILSDKTVGSKAFAGTYKNPTVKVPAKQLIAYEKLLKARGMSSKAVYRK